MSFPRKRESNFDTLVLLGGGCVAKEIYVEFIILGNTVKATAIDPETGEEASVIGPARAAQSTMAEAARRKLDYVLKKKG